MYLAINKCVTAVKVSNFSGHYLRNRSTMDIGVLGYIGIVQHKEHSPEVLSIHPGTSCICEEKVESFKYLGSVMTSLNVIETEVKSKIAVGNKCYHALGPILKRRSVSQSIKSRLYKTIIRPTVIYGAETWSLTSKVEKILMTWGRKILRKIYGPTKEKGQWRIKLTQN